MGVRLDKYYEKRRKKNKIVYGLVKFLLITFMLIGFCYSIMYVNSTMESISYLDNTVLFEVNTKDRMFTIFGKSYVVDFEKIVRIFKPD